ncbi:MAG: WD40 repeat domain-containing protein, partial [Actinomycetota bacterium]
PDGTLLATAREAAERANPSTTRVTIRDLDTGETVTTIDVWATDIAFDPTGRRIATASFYGPGEVWDAATGERLVRLTGHASDVRSIAFSPDGSRIATASGDSTIRLWDAGSGAQFLSLPGKDVWELEFSPDGSKLATSSFEGGVRIWALDLDDLIGIARSELTRELTDAECRQYLHQETCPAPA